MASYSFFKSVMLDIPKGREEIPSKSQPKETVFSPPRHKKWYICFKIQLIFAFSPLHKCSLHKEIPTNPPIEETSVKKLSVCKC